MSEQMPSPDKKELTPEECFRMLRDGYHRDEEFNNNKEEFEEVIIRGIEYALENVNDDVLVQLTTKASVDLFDRGGESSRQHYGVLYRSFVTVDDPNSDNEMVETKQELDGSIVKNLRNNKVIQVSYPDSKNNSQMVVGVDIDDLSGIKLILSEAK